jgi:hypothetical protein
MSDSPPNEAQQLALFTADLLPVLEHVCPQFGLDPIAVFNDAVKASSTGRNIVHHNVWQMEGVGDTGFLLSYTPIYTGEITEGGIKPFVRKLAKFSSLEAAAVAYCRAISA